LEVVYPFIDLVYTSKTFFFLVHMTSGGHIYIYKADIIINVYSSLSTLHP